MGGELGRRRPAAPAGEGAQVAPDVVLLAVGLHALLPALGLDVRLPFAAAIVRDLQLDEHAVRGRLEQQGQVAVRRRRRRAPR